MTITSSPPLRSADMVSQEDRGGGGKEEAQDDSRATPSTEGWVGIRAGITSASVKLMAIRFDGIGTPKHDDDEFPRSDRCLEFQAHDNA